MADYYVTYHQLMRHWHAVMPGAILDVHYEALVADPEAQARRILEWCSLEWEQGVLAPSDSESPAVSASAAQARQPIHTGSVEKWRRFASGLEPLRVRLGRAGVIES